MWREEEEEEEKIGAAAIDATATALLMLCNVMYYLHCSGKSFQMKMEAKFVLFCILFFLDSGLGQDTPTIGFISPNEEVDIGKIFFKPHLKSKNHAGIVSHMCVLYHMYR